MPVRPHKTPLEPKLVEIGRLFKGSKKQLNARGKEIFGSELEYFRFEPNDRLKNQPASEGSEYASRYEELLALYESLERKDAIRIFFPYPNIEQLWRESNEEWKEIGGKNTLIRLCNGETCSIHMENNRIMRTPIPCAAKPEDRKCPAGCKEVGRLPFVIPALKYPGTVILTTHSKRDISTLPANLEAYRGADLRCIPFLLERVKQNCPHVKDDGSVINKERWFCQLEIDPNFGARLLEGDVSHTRSLVHSTNEPLKLQGSNSTATIQPGVDEYQPTGLLQSNNPAVSRFESFSELTDIPMQIIRAHGSDKFGKNLGQFDLSEQGWLLKRLCVLWAEINFKESYEVVKPVWDQFWKGEYAKLEDKDLFNQWRSAVRAHAQEQRTVEVEVEVMPN